MPQPYPHGELLIVIDCADLDRSAAFWSAVLGYTAGPAATGPAAAALATATGIVGAASGRAARFSGRRRCR